MNSAGEKWAVPSETNHEVEEVGDPLESTARGPADAHASGFVSALDHDRIIPSS
jgi:hypothetical protein